MAVQTEVRVFLDQEEGMEIDETSLGHRIVLARRAQGLSSAQLARRLGVTSDTMHAWEAGHSEPRANRLTMLAGMLNVSPTWLLTGSGDHPHTRVEQSDLMHIQTTVEHLRESLLAIANELEDLQDRLKTYQSYQD